MPRTVFNLALKMAVFESRKKQKRIAHLARIDETQLSHIVRGRRQATPKQRKRLAAVLGKTEAVLFEAAEVSMPREPYPIATPSSVSDRTDGSL